MLAQDVQHRFAQRDVNLYEKLLAKARFSFWGPWVPSDDDAVFDPEGDTEASKEDLLFRAGLLSTGWYIEALVEDMLAFYSENQFLSKDFEVVQDVMTLGFEHLEGLEGGAKYLSFLRLMTDAKVFFKSLHLVFDEYEPVGLELRNELYSCQDDDLDNWASEDEEESGHGSRCVQYSDPIPYRNFGVGPSGCRTDYARDDHTLILYFSDPIINFFGRKMCLHNVLEMPGVSFCLFNFLRKKRFSADEAAEIAYVAAKKMQRLWRGWILKAVDDLCRIVQLEQSGAGEIDGEDLP